MVHCAQKPFLKKYFAKVKVDSIVTTLNKRSYLRMIIRCLDFNQGLDQSCSDFIFEKHLASKNILSSHALKFLW
jgi:hypothetical protein